MIASKLELGSRRADELKTIFNESDPNLAQLGIEPSDPAGNLLQYTTQEEAVENWFTNEHSAPVEERGAQVLKLLNDYWGISKETAFNNPALQDYWKYTKEGRFIGMVAMQYDNPTPYYLTNLLNVAQIHKASGGKVPVAFMTMEYPDDHFAPHNGDKATALFQNLKIPYAQPNGEIAMWEAPLAPKAIIQREEDMRQGQTVLSRMDSGNLLVQLDDYPVDAGRNKKEKYFKQFKGGKKCNDILFPADYDLAANLGIDINDQLVRLPDGSPTPYIRSTDLYRKIWNQSINNLRNSGFLPSEEEMPIYTVDALPLYTHFAQHAKPHSDFLSMMDWEDIPLREDGMMRGSAYYLVQPRWGSVYHECSSCMCLSNPNFAHALPRHDALRHNAGVNHTEVRLPDVELAPYDLENQTILFPDTFNEGSRAYMKTLYETTQTPEVQEIFDKI
ncbi:hypothetical protein BH09PAT2_BH09PAT2_04880 [soil metagenome]